MKKILILSLFIMLAGTSVFAQIDSDSKGVKRFGLFIGANQGGEGREELRYAISDASRLAELMNKHGGISKSDEFMLYDPSREAVFETFQKIKSKILIAKANSRRVELLFYYSGHSDASGLLLGKERLTYKELRESLAFSDADVHVAILDSCSSGSLTRGKGGTIQAPFLINDSSDVEGYAYLTSSSENEISQESDAIEAGFFTHYIISGLRGAADTSGDNKVTLQEAYEHAYAETLNRTENTLSGPQHPAYAIDLKGSGGLILTDLTTPSARLILSDDIDGQIYIRDANKNLVAEVNKSGGVQLALVLEEGTYTVRAASQNSTEILETTITVSRSYMAYLSENNFTARAAENNPYKGDTVADADDTEVATVEVTLASPEPQADENEVVASQFSPFVGSADVITGIQLSGIIGSTRKQMDGVQVSLVGNNNHGNKTGISAALVYNMVGDRADGVSLANVFNSFGGPSQGVSLAGIFNNYSSTAGGIMFAGMLNRVNGNSNALEMSGIGNINGGYLYGIATAGIFNIAGSSLVGTQLSGVFNIAGGDTKGVQAAGIFNQANGTLEGLQMAGIYNMASGLGNAMQLAGIFNMHRGSINGAQVSGLFNMAETVSGTQISLVNTSKEIRGLSLGLVNIAQEQYGPSIGLLNLIGNGIFGPVMMTNNDFNGDFSFGFQSGSRTFYSMFTAKFKESETSYAELTEYTMGLGVRVPLLFGIVYSDIDISQRAVWDKWSWTESNYRTNPRLRTALGVSIGEGVDIFIGYNLDFYIPELMNDTVMADYNPEHGKDFGWAKMNYELFAGVRFWPF